MMIRKCIIIAFLLILIVFDCFSQDTICYNLENQEYSTISGMDNETSFYEFDSNYSNSPKNEQANLDECYYKTQAPATSWFYDRFGINLILSASRQKIYGRLTDFEGWEYFKTKANILYGAGIGIFYEIIKTGSVIFCINLEYLQRGAELYIPIYNSVESHVEDIKTYNRIDYLSLPCIIKILFSENKINPQILFGIRLNYMISYDTEYLNRYFKKADKSSYGGIIGFCVEYKIHKYFTLIPSIKYDFDFNDLIGYHSDIYDLRFRNNSIDFSLGVKIK
jgi:hypothetical protein